MPEGYQEAGIRALFNGGEAGEYPRDKDNLELGRRGVIFFSLFLALTSLEC